MAQSRLLGLAVVLVGAGSMAAAPAPTAAPTPTPTARIQIAPQIMAPLGVTITQVGFTSTGYLVTVTNPTIATSTLELHFKGKTIPFDTKSKLPTFVNVVDPDAAALCNIGTLAFNLTGPNADTKIRHTQVVGSPAFTAKGGTLSGPAPVAGDTTGKVAMLSGGATHWYGCGTKFEISAFGINDTTVNPQNLKVELIDTDGSKMGEAPAAMPPKANTSVLVGSAANVTGRAGFVKARFTDTSPELDGQILQTRELRIEIVRSGGTMALKLVD